MQWVMTFANYQEDNTLFTLNWILIFVYFFPECNKPKKKNRII